MQLLGRRGFLVSSPWTDELTLLDDNLIVEVGVTGIHPRLLNFAALGLQSAPISSLLGGDALENAGILSAIIKGELPGPRQDVVCLNAMLGISAYRGINFEEAFTAANFSITAHKAEQKLMALMDKSVCI